MERTKLRNVVNVVAVVGILASIILNFMGYKAAIHIACAITYFMYVLCDIKEGKVKEKNFKFNLIMCVLWTFLAIVNVFDL